MNGHLTFSGCLISAFMFSTVDIGKHIRVGNSITLGILGTLAQFRHFSGLSGVGYSNTPIVLTDQASLLRKIF
jgi:hypothetical protein